MVRARQCFGFNNVAASVWRELAAPRTFEQLKQALLTEYEVEDERCATELRTLLDELCAKGLVAKSA